MYPSLMYSTPHIHLTWLDMIIQINRNTQNPVARMPRRLNIALWRLIFAVAIMELPSCHPSRAMDFDMASRFLEDL